MNRRHFLKLSSILPVLLLLPRQTPKATGGHAGEKPVVLHKGEAVVPNREIEIKTATLKVNMEKGEKVTRIIVPGATYVLRESAYKYAYDWEVGV